MFDWLSVRGGQPASELSTNTGWSVCRVRTDGRTDGQRDGGTDYKMDVQTELINGHVPSGGRGRLYLNFAI